jgi:membrane protease YdiL (CAAX protease family)
LHERIRRLPAGVEFLVVVSWAFGLPIFSSIMSLGPQGAAGAATGGALVFDNAALLGILVFELAQSAFLIWFLRIRGWTLAKFGLSISWRGTGVGWLLLVGTYVLAMVAQSLAQLAIPSAVAGAAARYPEADPQLSMQLVFLTSTVNGIFEELFVAGYIITALTATRGMWTAINVSTVVRLLYHLYQGPMGILVIVPMGLLYGYVYARTRQLWPLMLAHILIDIIGLSPLGRMLSE